MRLNNLKKNRGFTLIELLVSVGLFSVVLTVALGSIMTIADSNKKARSLMSVTNNLNFAVDSMVRSFKTGDSPSINPSGDCFSTNEIDYSQNSFGTRSVEYCFEEVDGKGKIMKTIGTETPVELTSTDVDIDSLTFYDTAFGSASTYQPMLTVVMQGTVKVSEKVSSSFTIQTSVSQRKLNI